MVREVGWLCDMSEGVKVMVVVTMMMMMDPRP